MPGKSCGQPATAILTCRLSALFSPASLKIDSQHLRRIASIRMRPRHVSGLFQSFPGKYSRYFTVYARLRHLLVPSRLLRQDHPMHIPNQVMRHLMGGGSTSYLRSTLYSRLLWGFDGVSLAMLESPRRLGAHAMICPTVFPYQHGHLDQHSV